MAAASTIAAIAAVSAALSAVGSIQQGKAAKTRANYRAAIQDQQAQLQHQQADRQRRLTAVQEAQQRRQQSRDLAAARVQLAAGGRDTTKGSALLLQEDAAAQNEFSALLARSLGLERAHSFENQANLMDLEAAGVRYSRAVARHQSRINTGTSLLRGASGLARGFGS